MTDSQTCGCTQHAAEQPDGTTLVTMHCCTVHSDAALADIDALAAALRPDNDEPGVTRR